ncbi:MAG: hypothetical protein HZB38_06905 [Planctomycetes bacterium]|nr:hypothetical protein [Planctomycetota bacterium]
MIRRVRSSWLWTAFLLLAAAPLRAQESVTLSPKFQKGRAVYIEQTARTTRQVKTAADVQPRLARSEITFGFLAVVEDVRDDRLAVMKLTIERIALHDEGGGKPSDIDTDRPAAASQPAIESAARAMIGKSITMSLRREGCLPREGDLEAVRSAAAPLAGDDPAFSAILGEFALERFRYSWGDARLALFSWRDVKSGESWENSLRQAAADGSSTTYLYRCKLGDIATSEGRPIAEVRFAGDISQSGAGPDARGVIVRLDDGTFSGSAKFDVQRGEFVVQETNARIRAIATLPARGQSPEQQVTIDQTIDSRTTIEPAETRAKRRSAAKP